MRPSCSTTGEKQTRSVLLLAPAGGFDSLEAALRSGADAVYFGVGELNMRAGAAGNFTEEDLPEIVSRCHARGAKAFLVLNTVLYDEELPEARRLAMAAKKAGVDACIAGDMAAILMLRELNMPVHLTVQCNISNLEALRFHAAFADVAVLARELPLESIRNIAEGIRRENIRGPGGELLKIELFIHGALCVALSGKCYMSLSVYNSSANRGRCFQNCRRRYLVRDAETGTELEIDNQYVMSPKDLCTVAFLDKLLNAGASVLKIEGRGRSADYVAATVSVYREALDSWLEGRFARERIPEWEKRLKEVFNRGFWEGGYYLGKKLGEWSASDGNRATIRKSYAGRISNYFSRLGVAEMLVEAADLHPGDQLLITGPTTGAVKLTVAELRLERDPVAEAPRGRAASFPVPVKVRSGDKVYLLTPAETEAGENP